MTRTQRDAARTAGACFLIVGGCLLAVVLCSVAGCAGDLGPDVIEAREQGGMRLLSPVGGAS